MSVGPNHLTRVLKRMNFSDILPFWAFVPYHFSETKHIGKFEKMMEYGSYAANLWGTTFGSWEKLRDFDMQRFHRRGVVEVDCALYRRRMTSDVLAKYGRIMDIFHRRVYSEGGIDYSIAYGTALGYKRHGTFIPWDDDFDIVVRRRDTSKISDMIRRDIADLCMEEFWGGVKIFLCGSPKAGNYKWGYPFVDIFDGRTAKVHANSLDEIMFPSRPMEMEGITLRGPHDIDRHLRLKFSSIDVCKSPHWNHAKEFPLRVVSFPCKDVMEQCYEKSSF